MMGAYTELCLAVELKADTPKRLIAALNYMTGNTDVPPKPLPDHEFFMCPRWGALFSGSSCYFTADSSSSFRFYGTPKSYRLSFRANFWNAHNEQENFLKLIEPWLGMGAEFVGHQRYEDEEHPTLIYVDADRKFVMRKPHHG